MTPGIITQELLERAVASCRERYREQYGSPPEMVFTSAGFYMAAEAFLEQEIGASVAAGMFGPEIVYGLSAYRRKLREAQKARAEFCRAWGYRVHPCVKDKLSLLHYQNITLMPVKELPEDRLLAVAIGEPGA